jgi:hypothetical protein
MDKPETERHTTIYLAQIPARQSGAARNVSILANARNE